MNLRNIFLVAMIVVVALTRVIPHEWNVTPVGAAALLFGACLPRAWQGFLAVFAVMSLGDLTLGLRSGSFFYPDMAFPYIAFGGMVVMGLLLRGRRRFLPIAVTGIAASLQFFIVSNFGSWLVGGLGYPHTLDGLGQAYLAGIPFYKWQFVGDVLFTLALFGLYRLAERDEKRPVASPSATV